MVGFSGTYTHKMNVKRFKAFFYIQYVCDTHRKRDETEKFFNGLNSYHPNIKLTVDEETEKFLDTKITRENGEM